jgi:hypothetical protein
MYPLYLPHELILNYGEGLLDLLQRVICENATKGKMRITVSKMHMVGT